MVIMLAVEVHKTSSRLLNLWVTWSPVVSLAIAAFALFISLSQARTGNKALRLSLQQDARRNARLDLNLKESVKWRPSGRRYKYIGVRILAVNPTESQATLTAAELRISYSLRSGKIVVLKIPHSTNKADLPEELVGLEIPAALPSNGALEGWLFFRLDDELIGDAPVEHYEVMVSDSRGISESIHPWIMKEIADHG